MALNQTMQSIGTDSSPLWLALITRVPPNTYEQERRCRLMRTEVERCHQPIRPALSLETPPSKH